MFGLDAWIASFYDGTTLALVCVVAVVLGLRHATDPDHLAAVSALIAGTRERATGAAARLGLVLGPRPRDDPVRLRPADRALPELPARAGAGGRRDDGRPRDRGTRRSRCSCAGTAAPSTRTTTRRRRARSPLQAYGIGLVHGMGGSAGVGVLLLASIQNQAIAVVALGAVRALHRPLDGGALDRPRLHARTRPGQPRLPARWRRSSASPAWRSASGTRSERSRWPPTISRWRRSPRQRRALRLGRARRGRGARVRGAPRLLRALPRGAGGVARGRRGARLRRRGPGAAARAEGAASWSRRGRAPERGPASGAAPLVGGAGRAAAAVAAAFALGIGVWATARPAGERRRSPKVLAKPGAKVMPLGGKRRARGGARTASAAARADAAARARGQDLRGLGDAQGQRFARRPLLAAATAAFCDSTARSRAAPSSASRSSGPAAPTGRPAAARPTDEVLVTASPRSRRRSVRRGTSRASPTRRCSRSSPAPTRRRSAELYDRFGRVAYGLALRILRDEALGAGRRPGGVPRRLAQCRPLPRRARQGEHLDPDARPPPRRRPRPPRGQPPRRAARARARADRARDRRGRGLARLSAPRRPGGARAAAARAARGTRARLLRRADPEPSSPSGSASRSGRSRAACSPGSPGCATCSTGGLEGVLRSAELMALVIS